MSAPVKVKNPKIFQGTSRDILGAGLFTETINESCRYMISIRSMNKQFACICIYIYIINYLYIHICKLGTSQKSLTPSHWKSVHCPVWLNNNLSLVTCFIVPCPPHHWVPYQNQVFFSVSRIMLNLQIARNHPNLYVIWLLWQTSRISGYTAAPPIRKSVPSLFASNTFLNRSSCALLGQRRVQTQSETMLFLLLSILAATCHRNWFLLYVYWDIHIMNKMKVYHISSYIIIYHHISYMCVSSSFVVYFSINADDTPHGRREELFNTNTSIRPVVASRGYEWTQNQSFGVFLKCEIPKSPWVCIL